MNLFNFELKVPNPFEKLFPKKPEVAPKSIEPFMTADGVKIEGPMADHMRSMTNIAESFEPGSVQKLRESDALKAAEAAAPPTSEPLTEEEKLALLSKTSESVTGAVRQVFADSPDAPGSNGKPADAGRVESPSEKHQRSKTTVKAAPVVPPTEGSQS